MKKKTNTDALNCLKTKEKKSKKRKIKDADLQIDEAVKNKKIKTMIEFDKNKCNSIKWTKFTIATRFKSVFYIKI